MDKPKIMGAMMHLQSPKTEDHVLKAKDVGKTEAPIQIGRKTAAVLQIEEAVRDMAPVDALGILMVAAARQTDIIVTMVGDRGRIIKATEKDFARILQQQVKQK